MPRANAVTWRDTVTGEFSTEEAKVVVLAGGTTENPRLWLNSGLPNPNGWVGQGYTDHCFDWMVGVFDNDVSNESIRVDRDSPRGVGSSARVDLPGHGGLEQVGLPPALQAFSLMFSNSGIRGLLHQRRRRRPGGAWRRPGLGGPPAALGLELKKCPGQRRPLINVLVLTDDDVQPVNRVTLSTLDADEHGPVAKVEFPRGHARRPHHRQPRVPGTQGRATCCGAPAPRRCSAWTGLLSSSTCSRPCAWARSAADSVLDANAKARFVDGLYIADNSALANALGGPNPTLTCRPWPPGRPRRSSSTSSVARRG